MLVESAYNYKTSDRWSHPCWLRASPCPLAPLLSYGTPKVGRAIKQNTSNCFEINEERNITGVPLHCRNMEAACSPQSSAGHAWEWVTDPIKQQAASICDAKHRVSPANVHNLCTHHPRQCFHLLAHCQARYMNPSAKFPFLAP